MAIRDKEKLTGGQLCRVTKSSGRDNYQESALPTSAKLIRLIAFEGILCEGIRLPTRWDLSTPLSELDKMRESRRSGLRRGEHRPPLGLHSIVTK